MQAQMPQKQCAKNGTVVWEQTASFTLCIHIYILKDIKFISIEHWILIKYHDKHFARIIQLALTRVWWEKEKP